MADAEPPAELRAALRQLEEHLGRSLSDASDGHARWELYRAALGAETARPALLAAVAAEPDGALASGVVGEALEGLPRTERDAWVQALAPEVRGFSERRVRELGVLEDLRSGALAAAGVPELIDAWSDWLQLRLATESDDATVLRALAASGRTKRIRRTAGESLG
ncbi:hypothetical protein [Streptomyces ficellus]|uniref:HEAT repeat domain-containing protein n=1 Tax=Streptomyces ficellus TaxID=1977088 RepID=A0A6I6F487_9ACTN|nr:hypothetical protein [Streptomyces ficellus]QGV78430.1 hypothetical protein EIZ62_09385 [Streptomyces ficellus]